MSQSETPREVFAAMLEEWAGDWAEPAWRDAATRTAKRAEWLARFDAADEWISVEERLPEPAVDVLGASSHREVFIAQLGAIEWPRFDGRGAQIGSTRWLADDGTPAVVTHWRPLPEPPK